MHTLTVFKTKMTYC